MDSLVAERVLLLLATLLVVLVRTALWMLPSPLSLSAVRRLANSGALRRHGGRRPPVDRLTRAVEAVSRHIPRATCLTQAVSAKLLLRRFGYDSRLCVGVARSARGEYCAHAWLEHNGRIVIGGTDSLAYTRLSSFDANVASRREDESL